MATNRGSWRGYATRPGKPGWQRARYNFRGFRGGRGYSGRRFRRGAAARSDERDPNWHSQDAHRDTWHQNAPRRRSWEGQSSWNEEQYGSWRNDEDMEGHWEEVEEWHETGRGWHREGDWDEGRSHRQGWSQSNRQEWRDRHDRHPGNWQQDEQWVDTEENYRGWNEEGNWEESEYTESWDRGDGGGSYGGNSDRRWEGSEGAERWGTKKVDWADDRTWEADTEENWPDKNSRYMSQRASFSGYDMNRDAHRIDGKAHTKTWKTAPDQNKRDTGRDQADKEANSERKHQALPRDQPRSSKSKSPEGKGQRSNRSLEKEALQNSDKSGCDLAQNKKDSDQPKTPLNHGGKSSKSPKKKNSVSKEISPSVKKLLPKQQKKKKKKKKKKKSYVVESDKPPSPLPPHRLRLSSGKIITLSLKDQELKYKGLGSVLGLVKERQKSEPPSDSDDSRSNTSTCSTPASSCTGRLSTPETETGIISVVKNTQIPAVVSTSTALTGNCSAVSSKSPEVTQDAMALSVSSAPTRIEIQATSSLLKLKSPSVLSKSTECDTQRPSMPPVAANALSSPGSISLSPFRAGSREMSPLTPSKVYAAPNPLSSVIYIPSQRKPANSTIPPAVPKAADATPPDLVFQKMQKVSDVVGPASGEDVPSHNSPLAGNSTVASTKPTDDGQEKSPAAGQSIVPIVLSVDSGGSGDGSSIPALSRTYPSPETPKLQQQRTLVQVVGSPVRGELGSFVNKIEKSKV